MSVLCKEVWHEADPPRPRPIGRVSSKSLPSRVRLQQAQINANDYSITTRPVPARNINPARRHASTGSYSGAGEKSPLLGAGRRSRRPTRIYYGTGSNAVFIDVEANRRADEVCRRWERQWDIESCVLIVVILIALAVFAILSWKTQVRFGRG